ncbi:hypothetical protein O3M35_003466 [Rhynocoris fuscipes]|uniref:NADH dehydrogenase [ubiquinone] 1 beta subcomplex subunit 4 n=1 Tax=Rhynocoris fuscipes TaxID=488301 RepID=A0AAW1CN54_9HEMI
MGDKEISQELINLKNQQRAALRREYWKQITNPHSQESYVFDPALQRYLSLQKQRWMYFRDTPKSVLRGILLLVLPFAGTIYLFGSSRAKREASLRAGEVAYKDRLFKFK